MKIAAHPLVVAVALGLLGPVSLEDVEEPRLRDNKARLSTDSTDGETDTEPLAAEDLARAEADYERVTLLLDHRLPKASF